MHASSVENSHPALPIQFHVGEWCVDSSQQTISRGGESVTLEPKMMALLIFLAEHSGESISRERLEQEVWQGTVVGYDALTSTINKLRKALGDNSNDPIYIKTIQKVGYCFIAPVKLMEDSNRPAVSKTQLIRSYRKWIISSIVFFVVILVSVQFFYPQPEQYSTKRQQSLPTLVVLPFEDLNQAKGKTYFSDGMTADITTALSKLSGLFVISWKSAMVLPGNTSQDIRDIAKTLNVRYVLQGSLRRTKDRVRINAQLIDATSGVNLWAERYDREIKTVLDLQDEIAAEIATALSITLTAQEKLHQSRRYTTNIDAYDKFLQGQAAYVRSNREDNLLARSLFQSAVDKDRHFARAYGGLALTHADEARFHWGNEPDKSLDLALELAKKAVSIDNQLPQVYWVMGYIYLQKRDYVTSIEKTKIAIDLDPNNSDGYVMLALSTLHNGDPESAIRLVNKGMNLNPHYPARYPSVLGQSYFYLGQYEAAIYPLREATRKNIELITPRIYLIAALEKSGQHEEALWEANQLKVLMPGFKVNFLAEMIPNRDREKLQDIMQQLRLVGLE